MSLFERNPYQNGRIQRGLTLLYSVHHGIWGRTKRPIDTRYLLAEGLDSQ